MGKSKKPLGLFLVSILLIAVGVIVGWLISSNYHSAPKYSLLDPSVENPNISQAIIDFDPLRQEIKGYLDSLNLGHSFYFEYLPNGVNIRDGSDTEAIAASLLKTPLVMDLYKLAETNKLDLDSTIRVEDSDISTDMEYGDPSGLRAGQTLSLRNAAEIALEKSDNTAISLVRRTVQPLVTTDTDVFESLDVTYTVGAGNSTNGGNNNSSTEKTVLISARSYSSILKCLYYSCFLQPADSQIVLNTLIGSSGQERLPSGVPKTVEVAHKIGSSGNGDSDCGIFYAPKKPYLVCLIFRGQGTDKLHDTDKYFQHVSELVYDYVISKN